MSRGLFITFEGGEGSGKTTQINRAAKFLSDQGHKVVTTRNPGGTPEAEKIRDLFVTRDGVEWTPEQEALLVLTALSSNYEKVVKPALEAGKIVICDRFFDSTLAYQGYGHGLDKDTLLKLRDMVMSDCMPDLTVILDVDPEVGLARSNHRLNDELSHEGHFEGLDLYFHRQVHQGFLNIAAEEPGRCTLVDASQPLEDVSAAVIKVLEERV